MKKIILAPLFALLFAGTFAQAQLISKEDYVLKIQCQDGKRQVIMETSDLRESNHLDTFYMALVSFILQEIDSSICGESFSVYKSNKNKVGMLISNTYNVYVGFTSKQEQVILLQNNHSHGLNGGKLEIVGDSWVLKPDGRITQFNSKGKTEIYIGDHHGKFILYLNDFWDAQYDDGY